MIQKHIIWLILLLAPLSSVAQDFKTNGLQPFSFSYEQFLPKYRSLQLNLQYKPNSFVDEGECQWVRIGLEGRRYKGRKHKILNAISHPQRGEYISPYVRYSGCDGFKRNRDYTVKRVSVGGTIGYKTYVRAFYILEVFAGAGYSPWVNTSNAILSPERDHRFEANLGVVIGISARKNKRFEFNLNPSQ